MRAVVIDGPASISVVDRPDPTLPGPDGAIVEVSAAAICGSDLHFYDGDYPLFEPVSLGHEAIGTVVEVGPDVRTAAVGDRVLVSSVAGCGACAGCATLDPIRCVRGRRSSAPGHWAAPRRNCSRCPRPTSSCAPFPLESTTSRHCCSPTTW